MCEQKEKALKMEKKKEQLCTVLILKMLLPPPPGKMLLLLQHPSCNAGIGVVGSQRCYHAGWGFPYPVGNHSELAGWKFA